MNRFHHIAVMLSVCVINFHAVPGELPKPGDSDSCGADAAVETGRTGNQGFPTDSLVAPSTVPQPLPPEWPPEKEVLPPMHSDTISGESGAANADAAATDTAATDSIRDSLPFDSVPAPLRPAWLYPAISIEQDRLACQMLRYFHTFDWNNAEKTGKKMQRLEKKRHLPPLSYLLLTGMFVMRVQNGAYHDDRAKKDLLHDIKKLSSKGLELANPQNSPDSCLTADLFITGGIKGFMATLEIHKNPVSAALDGFEALKYLRQTLDRDTTVYDAYLGFGLFHCILGKAPLIVRSALTIIGKDASFEKGLEYLRRTVLHGRYTDDIANLYLAEFLSPYWGHEAEEKGALVRSLQSKYPENPYFVFLELEEDLCFHPDMLFSFSLKERILRSIVRFKTPDDDAERYAMLVKWQYLLIDPLPAKGIAPDTTFDLRSFSYYPIFLRALREKLIYEQEPAVNKRDRSRRLRYIKEKGAAAARLLEASPHMPAGRKHLYLWHIRDALRIERKTKR